MARNLGSNKVAMSRIEVADLICPTRQMAPLFGEGTTDEPFVLEEHGPTPSGEHPALVGGALLPVMEAFDLRMSGMVPIEDPVVVPMRVITIPPRAADTVEMPPLANPANDSTIGTVPTVPGPLVPDAPIVAHAEAAPIVIDDSASDATLKNRSGETSLGVAPLEPATRVRAPFVIDTPVRRWSPLGRTPQSSTAPGNAIAQAPQAHPIVTPRAQGSTRIPTQADIEDKRHERTAMIALDPTSGMPRTGPWQSLIAVAKSLGSVRWWGRRRKTSRVKPLVP